MYHKEKVVHTNVSRKEKQKVDIYANLNKLDFGYFLKKRQKSLEVE